MVRLKGLPRDRTLLEGGSTYDGDRTLARHVANCVVRESSSGIVITKPDPTRKIDAALAVVAYDRAAPHAAFRRRSLSACGVALRSQDMR